MTNFPDSDVSISSADCAEIETIFIELMRARDAAHPDEAHSLALPFVDPPGNAQDLRSQRGLQ
jgi:hypothetical protein